MGIDRIGGGGLSFSNPCPLEDFMRVFLSKMEGNCLLSQHGQIFKTGKGKRTSKMVASWSSQFLPWLLEKSLVN